MLQHPAKAGCNRFQLHDLGSEQCRTKSKQTKQIYSFIIYNIMQSPPSELCLQLNQISLISLWNALACELWIHIQLFTAQSKRSMMQNLVLIFANKDYRIFSQAFTTGFWFRNLWDGLSSIKFTSSEFAATASGACSVGGTNWSLLHGPFAKDALRLLPTWTSCKQILHWWDMMRSRNAKFGNESMRWRGDLAETNGSLSSLMLSSVFTDHFANDRAIAFANSWANARHSRTSIQPICIPCFTKQGKKKLPTKWSANSTKLEKHAEARCISRLPAWAEVHLLLLFGSRPRLTVNHFTVKRRTPRIRRTSNASMMR